MTVPVTAARTGRSPGGSSHRGGHRDRRRAVLGRVTLVVSVTAGDPGCVRWSGPAVCRTHGRNGRRSPTPLAPAWVAAPGRGCDTSARDLSHACAGRTGLCDRCDTFAAPPRRRRSGRGDVSQPGICRICRTARTERPPCDTSPGPVPRPCGRGPTRHPPQIRHNRHTCHCGWSARRSGADNVSHARAGTCHKGRLL